MTITGYVHVAMELWGVIFCMISSLCIYMGRGTKEKSNDVLLVLHLSNALLLFADAFAWIYRGKVGMVGYYVVHISNFVVFFTSYIMQAVFTEYLTFYIGQDTKGKKLWRRLSWGVVILGIVMLIVSQFNHMYYYFDATNTYHRNYLFFLTQISGILGLAINAAALIKYRRCMEKTIFYSLLTYIFLPVLAMIVQLFIYGISFLNIAITISVLWMFIILQINRGKKLKEQAELLIEQKNEMNEMQRKIMLSQIQPHFLYNSLNTIYYLCDKDTTVAQRAINDFSEYLRGNLDSLKTIKPVPFTTELKHLKNYIALEQLRFEDELTVIYDIEEDNFSLPAISIQPLVENAVKHGVGKAVNGGTVTIATKKTKAGYTVIVADDGVGFDPEEEKEDGRSHIGIENVRQRLQLMCNGTLTIESEKGKGTRAVIVIPEN